MVVDLHPEHREPKATAEALRRATRKGWSEVAPGKWVRTARGKAPDQLICQVLENRDGTFRFVPLEDRMVKITPALTRRLGMGSTTNTLHYLGRAGFVEVARPAPKLCMLNLDSFYNHLRRTVEDPDFWSRPKNIEAYRDVLPAGVTAKASPRNKRRDTDSTNFTDGMKR